MELPRVYADFNGIEHSEDGASAVVHLTGYGTIRSLSNQKLRLAEGMAIVVESDDIEADAIAHFDSTLKDPAGRTGAWVARLDPKQFRDAAKGDDFQNGHACFECGKDLKQITYYQRYNEHCPDCGTSVMAPLAPPASAT